MTFYQLTDCSFYGVFDDITRSDCGFTTYSLDKQIRETFVYMNEFVGFRCNSTEVELLARRLTPSIRCAVQREFTEEERLDIPIRVLTRMFSHVFDAFYAECSENILEIQPLPLQDLEYDEIFRSKYLQEQESNVDELDGESDDEVDDDYEEFGKTSTRRQREF